MAALKDAHKLFIVERLACFATPGEVQKALKETFGIEVPASTLLRYDPTTVQGSEELGQRWKDLFAAARARFLSDVSAIPIANQSYRLRRLQRILDDPALSRSPVTVMSALEQAAKEVGGALTNRRELTGKNGGPMEVQATATVDLSDVSDEDLKTLERILGRESAPGPSGPADASGDPGGASAPQPR